MNVAQIAVARRLYLARRMLSEGIEDAKNPSDLARMKAILALDHAVELVVATLLSELRIDVKPKTSLPEMLRALCSEREGLKSHLRPILALHDSRNAVQHNGSVPSAEDVRLQAVYAEAFVRDSVREVENQELEETSLVSLIESDRVRSHLLKGESALNAGDFANAAAEAAVAFKLGWHDFWQQMLRLGTWTGRLTDRFLRELGEAAKRAASLHDRQTKQFASALARELHSYSVGQPLQEMIRPLELARNGISIPDLARFERITPHVFWTIGSIEPQAHQPEGWNPGETDARFAVDFACAALLVLESRAEHDEPGETES